MRISLIIIAFMLCSTSVFVYADNTNHTGRSDYKGPNKGAIAWSKPVSPAGFVYVAPLVDKNGVVYFPFQVVRGPQGLMALTADGKEKWKYDFKEPNRVFFSGYSLSQDEKSLYLVTGIQQNSFLTAFSIEKGLPEWTVKLEGGVFYWSRIALSSEGNIYFANRKGIYAIDKRGDIVWKYLINSKPNFSMLYSPTLSADEKTIYLLSKYTGDEDKIFFVSAMDANSGKLLWKAKEPVRVYGEYETLAVDPQSGAIYVGSMEKKGGAGYLYAFNPDGSLKWKHSVGGGDMNYVYPSIGRDGTAYIMTGYGSPVGLIAVAPDGIQKWRYQPPNNNRGNNFIVIDKEERLYFLFDTNDSVNRGLYCIDKNGKLIFKVSINDSFWGAAPAISPDGSIYVFSEKGILYSIK